MPSTRLPYLILVLFLFPAKAFGQDGFAVHPFVQINNSYPISQGGYLIKWYSRVDEPGEINYSTLGQEYSIRSQPQEKPELRYSDWEVSEFGSQLDLRPFFEHLVELEFLNQDTPYAVTQSGATYSDTVRVPYETEITRFIVFGDSETEPESSGKFADWPDPRGRIADRKYLVDQTDGLAANLDIIRKRNPHFVIIAGDLVESGGEQRDWDEFWRHMTHSNPDSSLAGSAVILAAPGNHEYYHGPSSGGYDQPFSEQALSKFQTYFEFPDNGSGDEKLADRYFSMFGDGWDIISLDVTNGTPHQSSSDTNYFLEGGNSPTLQSRSHQRTWLRDQLRPGSRLKLVTFHHVPFSSGPHGYPAGIGDGFDEQSGVPTRELMDEFAAVATTAILAGHDEMYERSEYENTIAFPRKPPIQVYDIGIAGDGLRAPVPELNNPQQVFLAHNDSPEIYSGDDLIDGGKHYGHLEIDYERQQYGTRAFFRPVYSFPLSSNGQVLGFERRVYPDSLDLFISSSANTEEADDFGIQSSVYPNPSSSLVNLSIKSPNFGSVTLVLFDVLGRQLGAQEIDLLPNEEKRITYRINELQLSNGNYYVQITGSKTRKHLKFVVQK